MLAAFTPAEPPQQAHYFTPGNPDFRSYPFVAPAEPPRQENRRACLRCSEAKGVAHYPSLHVSHGAGERCPLDPAPAESQTLTNAIKIDVERMNSDHPLPAEPQTPEPGCQAMGPHPVSSDARPARTLKDYRPQHDPNCASRLCAQCGFTINWLDGTCRCNDYPRSAPRPCSCGLDALLSGGAPHGR